MPPEIHNEFVILVPVDPTAAESIARGAAIVARADYWTRFEAGDSNACIVYFEGDVHGFHYGQFGDMIHHAAGRCAQRYPTIAKLPAMSPAQFRVVGTYALAEKKIRIDDVAAFGAWAPGATLQ